jgi:hypothetical protein
MNSVQDFGDATMASQAGAMAMHALVRVAA